MLEVSEQKSGEATPRITPKTIIDWARGAKVSAEAAGLEPMPRDENFVRAAVAFEMLTRGPYPSMTVVSDVSEAFNRSTAPWQ